MRVIINLVVILPCFLSHVHGLVIPRDELDGWGITNCDLLDFCSDIVQPLPIDISDNSLDVDNDQSNSEFPPTYTDPSGADLHLELDLNKGIFQKLQDSYGLDPLSITNKPFIDQLREQLPTFDNPQTDPSPQSFELDSHPNFFTQAETIPSPVDDIWGDDFGFFN